MKYDILAILKSILPQSLRNQVNKQNDKKKLNQWNANSLNDQTPHIIKQLTIKEYQKNKNYQILVETGTYLGDMIEAQKNNFKKIYSIELDGKLFIKAKKRFSKDLNVSIVQGDSGMVLPEVLKEINEPAIFWLDGHYSSGITAKGNKDCPIFEELNSIFNSKTFDHTFLIDDASYFNGVGDYPTIADLTRFVEEKNKKYTCKVKDDIIRFEVN